MILKHWFRTLLFVLPTMAVIWAAEEDGRASKAVPLELAELPARAEVVLLAKVMRVEEKPLDNRIPPAYHEVAMRVASVIKGKLKQKELRVTLQPRGVKGFDPVLKVGDIGVFFLREVRESKAKLAYWGSVAVFQKPNFVVSDKPEKPGQPAGRPKMVRLETTMGNILIELDEGAAPVTVKNFLRYTEEGFYDGTVFHRVIPGFMIQGGGFTTDMKGKETHPPIVNEFKLSNLRGTVAMAKMGDNPNSATSQFFINLTDNSRNLDRQNGGFTVFGRVVEGMDVVDAIAAVKRTTKVGTNSEGQRIHLTDNPVAAVVIESARVMPSRQD